MENTLENARMDEGRGKGCWLEDFALIQARDSVSGSRVLAVKVQSNGEK